MREHAISQDHLSGTVTTPAIVNFPPELIDHIHGFAGPQNHFNFALTCRRIANSSQDILERHRNAHAQFGVSSDLNPTTVPNLLRSVTQDPIVAWNVHTFESWGSRGGWNEWQPFLSVYRREQGIIDDDIDMSDDHDENGSEEELDEGDTDIESDDDAEDSDDESVGHGLRESLSPERDFDISGWDPRMDRFFRREELETYIQYLQDVIGISDSQATRAWEEIQGGSDGILKVLLFCLCPRLRVLRYASSGQAGSNDARMRPSSLNWLYKVIFMSNDKQHWPQGLASLREVAMGIDSGFGNNMRQPPVVAFSLLHLPNVKSIYIAGGDRRWDEENEADWDDEFDVSPGSSSVEHLFMDNCNLTLDYYMKAMLQAPKNLITFALRGGSAFDAHEVVNEALEKQFESLETIIFYASPFWRDYSVLAFNSDTFQKLKCYDLLMTNILEEARKDTGKSGWATQTMARETFAEWFHDKLPASTEVLVLRLENHHGNFPMEDADIEIVDEAIARMLESGKYENIKAIYFERFGPYNESSAVGKKSVEAGQKLGVEVHARCNDHPLSHSFAFPTAPEKYDLVTGPWASQRRTGQIYDRETRSFVHQDGDGHRAFDPWDGRWVNR